MSTAETVLAECLRSRWQGISPVTPAMNDTVVEQLMAAIHFHGLAGIIRKFHMDWVNACAPVLLEPLSSAVQAQSRLALLNFASLCQVSDVLTGAGIAHMPLKGTVLSHHLYGDISARASGDVDVLIDPDDVSRTLNSLRDSGWEPTMRWPENPSEQRLAFRTWHHIGLRRPGAPLLEIHWRTDPIRATSLPRLKDIAGQLPTIRVQGREFLWQSPDSLLRTVSERARRSICLAWKWNYDVLELVMRAGAANPLRPPENLARTLPDAASWVIRNTRAQWRADTLDTLGWQFRWLSHQAQHERASAIEVEQSTMPTGSMRWFRFHLARLIALRNSLHRGQYLKRLSVRLRMGTESPFFPLAAKMPWAIPLLRMFEAVWPPDAKAKPAAINHPRSH